jgi:hypothetical protein
MNAITSYIGPRIRPGTIQQPPRSAAIESRSCGERHRIIFSLSSQLQCRYLTKMCDQVVVLLSPEYSASIVEDRDTESVDMGTRNTGRRFTFEVSKRNEQEESAVARPGFQVPIPFVFIKISLLIRQRCIFVTSHVIKLPLMVQLTQRSSCLVFCLGKLYKAF